MKVRIALATLLLAACGQQRSAPPAAATPAGATSSSAAPALSWAGYGPVIFGSSLAAVEQAIGPRNHAGQPLEAGCAYVDFPTLPGVKFMVEEGVITRADADRDVGNVLGIGVDAPLAQVAATHPEARITPHKYDENGHYLTFPSPNGNSAIVMEASADRIAAIRAGLEPSVSYVEGCL